MMYRNNLLSLLLMGCALSASAQLKEPMQALPDPLLMNDGTTRVENLSQWSQQLIVCVPAGSSVLIDHIRFFKLGIEERCVDIAWQIGGSHFDPGVLVDLSAEESAPVGKLPTR